MPRKPAIIITSLLLSAIIPGCLMFLVYISSRQVSDPVTESVVFQDERKNSVDHSQFEILQQDFQTPFEVTEACLSCHNGRDEEIMQTAHWKWEREVELPNGRGKHSIGKKNLINNFCTGANGNNGSCMRCHIGYGWKDESFDFGDNRNIDCLVCHDNTDTYFKRSGQAGMPATVENATAEQPVPDYPYVAQNIGLPGRNNCGVCHFFGGGGNNVKHGDLEVALLDCKREVDVHMSIEGKDMACVDCHKTEKHNIKGKHYGVSAMNINRISCEDCHSDAPHNDRVIDQHNHKVACQTCHIPRYAKVNATKMWWDWTTAGLLTEDGHAYSENDADGNHNYLSIKGNFVWDDNVKPEYQWFNGTADHYLFTDTISVIPVKINELMGCYADSASKIWPVKVHRGRQMYDTKYKTLISMKLAAENVGQGAFWKDFDWDLSATLGMAYNGRPYSGEYDFVETEVSWPINHMVSPKEDVVSCIECHSDQSRLADIKDIYIPGRDHSTLVDRAGLGLLILSLLGIFVHALLRYYLGKKTTKK